MCVQLGLCLCLSQVIPPWTRAWPGHDFERQCKFGILKPELLLSGYEFPGVYADSKPHIMIFGLPLTGTNLLRILLELNFSGNVTFGDVPWKTKPGDIEAETRNNKSGWVYTVDPGQQSAGFNWKALCFLFAIVLILFHEGADTVFLLYRTLLVTACIYSLALSSGCQHSVVCFSHDRTQVCRRFYKQHHPTICFDTPRKDMEYEQRTVVSVSFFVKAIWGVKAHFLLPGQWRLVEAQVGQGRDPRAHPGRPAHHCSVLCPGIEVLCVEAQRQWRILELGQACVGKASGAASDASERAL